MEGPMITAVGLKCGAASLITKQYRGVKLDGSGDVIVCSAQGERGIGMLLNKPAVGEAAQVALFGTVPFNADALVAVGAPLTVQNDGQVMTAGAGDYVWGFCLIAAGAAGYEGTMLLAPQGVL
jgi:hypothetical protein